MSSQLKEKKQRKRHTNIFTPRESECVNQAIQGKNLSEIATRLNISKQTVCFYINALRKKLDALARTIDAQ